MTVLFGHPTGNSNAHHAALAHFQAGWLEAYCVPWMPPKAALDILARIPGLSPMARRLRRRSFPPLAKVATVQDPLPEIGRLLIRALGGGSEALSYRANDALMRMMARETRRPAVTAVHSYEDCSLWQFTEAKRLGKACIYDMPIGFYPVWQQKQLELAQTYADWLPAHGMTASPYVRPEQKRQEIELADLVLVASSFAEQTIRASYPDKKLARAAYGVDIDFWKGGVKAAKAGPLRFLYAGQLSLRKGSPVLLNAWEKAALKDAELELVGQWQLADGKRKLPANVRYRAPCSAEELREFYRAADVFVFPSLFEGFGLVLLEAMATGLPAIASDATAGPDIITAESGYLMRAGDTDALVEGLRWFASNRDRLPAMSKAAREQAARCTWPNYRRAVVDAVAPFV